MTISAGRLFEHGFSIGSDPWLCSPSSATPSVSSSCSPIAATGWEGLNGQLWSGQEHHLPHLRHHHVPSSSLSSFAAEGGEPGAPPPHGAPDHAPAGEAGEHPPADAAAGGATGEAAAAAAAPVDASHPPHPAPPPEGHSPSTGHPQDVAHLKRIYNENSGPSKPDEDDVKYPPGRTSAGNQCDCTDPEPQISKILKDNEEGSSGLNAAKKMTGMKKGANHAALGHDAVALELEKQQRLAERRNANQSMKEPLQEFQQAMQEYDKARQVAGLDYSNYMSHREKYDHAFWELKAYHDGLCRKFMDKHVGIVPDCEPQFRLARSGYFARRRWPRCFVGKTSIFDHLNHDGSTASESSMPGLLPLLPLIAPLQCSESSNACTCTTSTCVCTGSASTAGSVAASSELKSSSPQPQALCSSSSCSLTSSMSWGSVSSDDAEEGDFRCCLNHELGPRRPTALLQLSMFL